MKLDWQHIVLILLAVTSAVSPFASQAAHGQPVDTGAMLAAAFALVTTIGALLKASVLPSVTQTAALKNAAKGTP